MKRLILILGVSVFMAGSLLADGTPTKEEWKNMTRAERKEYKEAETAQQHKKLMEMLESQQWVLEATQLQDRSGQVYYIESNLNFIAVANDKSTVQLGSTSNAGGRNGVGGLTVDGRVNKYEVKEVRRSNSGATIVLSITSVGVGHTTFNISVSPSGHATATLRSSGGARITYTGTMVPLDQSNVYKGIPLF